MAGVVPKRSPSGRKQWTIQDGHKSSLKLLRNQLASEGCPESQVVLAKQLLENNHQYQSISEKKENEQLGVYWLIKASQQGNTEATELLKKCLKTGKGISEYNFLDVKSCIQMSQDEKLTRKAAREIFASLSNGGDYITTDQLQKEILSIGKNKGVKLEHHSESLQNGDILNGELAKNEGEINSDSDSDTDWTLRSDSTSCSEKLTEDNLVAAAVDYSHGNLPLMSKSLCLTPPDLRALDNIPYIYRSILHPWLVLQIFLLKILRFLGNKFELLNIKSELQLFLIVCIYSFLNSDNILLVLPIGLYYITFICMAISTCQMLQNQRNFRNFRLWSGLFLCYSGGSLNSDTAEQLYLKSNLKPYGHFFLALLMNLLIYSVISEQWAPDSELTIVSFILTFITLIGFMPKNNSKTRVDLIVLLSFAVNVLAKYPYDTDPVVTQGWRFLDLNIPTFPSYIVGNGIEFCLNFRLVLYAVVPILFLKLASRNNWRGTYQCLIPHSVTLSWLQIFIISSQGATMYGLARGVLALVGVVMFLPLVGLTSILLPAIAVAKWIVTSNIIYTIAIFVCITCVGYLISRCLAQTRFRNYTALIQIAVMLSAFAALLNSVKEPNSVGFFTESQEHEHLSWDEFQRHCHQPVWQDENVALAQINCAELENSLIHWEGYVNDVKIKSVSNVYKNIFDKFPSAVRNYLACYFGVEVSNSACENVSEKISCINFHNAKKYTNQCSLEKYNKYTFEIIVRMNSGIWGKSPEVSLIVDNYFKNFTLKLKPGDHIWFVGKLFNNEKIGSDGILGGSKPHVLLDEIRCHTCVNKLTKAVLEKRNIHVYSIVQYLFAGFKFVFNVLFNPVVVFK